MTGARPFPSFLRGLLATLLASVGAALGGALGIILWILLFHEESRNASGGSFADAIVVWLTTAPLAVIFGILPAFVGVTLFGWPITLLLNSRGWFGPIPMIVAGALTGGAAGFFILPLTGTGTYALPMAAFAGSVGGVGAALGLLTAFSGRAGTGHKPL